MSQFHFNISPWMLKSINNKYCSKCQESIIKENIIGIGIREFKNKLVIFLEHLCKCGYKEVTPVIKKNMTIEEMCYSLLEESQNRKAIHISQHLELPTEKMTPISQKEADEFIKFLKDVPNHDLFMKHIGDLPVDDN